MLKSSWMKRFVYGLREWDISGSKTSSSGKAKLPECDLLEVYDEATKERLMELERRDWNILKMNDVSRSSTKEGKMEEDDMFRFTTERDEEAERLLGEMNSANTARIAFKQDEKEGDNEEINIDDI